MSIVFKDLVPENTHPLNLLELPEDEAVTYHPRRPPLFEVYMRMAEELAKRSTCRRLSVGTVITDPKLENVVAIGYNGNARGFPNDCDSPTPGACGCIHSEMNALAKAPGRLEDKVVFVTASPCLMCAKLMIQARVSHLFYRTPYRRSEGLEALDRAGVLTVRYDRWRDEWRGEGVGDDEDRDAIPARSRPDGVQKHEAEKERLVSQGSQEDPPHGAS